MINESEEETEVTRQNLTHELNRSSDVFNDTSETGGGGSGGEGEECSGFGAWWCVP